ncbi:MAG: hypothetical protein QG608_702 [Actinomycetota bacterium]|nr:hypothetical protein [Actinomycetota bacterium]
MLVDGTITPCWSYEDHPGPWSRKHATTGFNAQLLSLLDGTPVCISDPLPGKTHDAKAFTHTPIQEIVKHSGGAIANKGYQGHVAAVPEKTPPGGELSPNDKKCNAEISALRAPVERVIAHFKSWRIFPTDHRCPHRTYDDAHDATRGLFLFSLTGGFE